MGFDITGLGALGEVAGKLIDRFIPNPQEKAKALLELEQMKQTGELAKMANDTDLYKTEVDDRKSARTIHTSFVDFLAIAIIIGAGYMIHSILTIGVSKDINEMTGGMIIQFIINAPLMVLAYYFGSSSGSKAKNEAINQALKNK